MTDVPAQFDCVDGGDCNPSGDAGYHSVRGVTGFRSIQQIGGRYYFHYGSYGAAIAYAPPKGFSAARAFIGARLINITLNGYMHYNFLNSNGNAQFYISPKTDGSLALYSGSTLLYRTAAHVVVIGVPFHLEVLPVISASAGAVTAWLNGSSESVIAVTGVNTAADPTALDVRSTVINAPDGDEGFATRDMFFHDGTGPAPFNGRLGDVSGLWRPARVVVSNSGFITNGGSTLDGNAATTPPNPLVDFDSASAVSSTMTLGLAPLPGNVVEVIAQRVMDFSYKSDTGARALQKTQNFGSNAVAGTENYLTTGPVLYMDDWVTTDPITGVLLAGEGSTGVTNAGSATVEITVAA